MKTLKDFIDYVGDEFHEKALVMPVYDQLGCKDEDEFFSILYRVSLDNMAVSKYDGFYNFEECREFFQENEKEIMAYITARAEAEGMGVMSYIFSIKDVEAPDAQTAWELRGEGASDWVMSVVSRDILKHFANGYEIYCDHLVDDIDEKLNKLMTPTLFELAEEHLGKESFCDFALMVPLWGEMPFEQALRRWLIEQLSDECMTSDSLVGDVLAAYDEENGNNE